MSDTHDIGCELALKRLVEFVDGELREGEHDGVEQRPCPGSDQEILNDEPGPPRRRSPCDGTVE